MDYYSQMNMPGVEERKQNLLTYAYEYAKTTCTLPNSMIEPIVSQIVSETKAYSLTGYKMYGVMEERSKLEKAIKTIS